MFDASTSPIIDKIKKMLAVQRSTNHEGEANAAAGLIQKMLQDHGLSMAQVEAQTGEKAKDDRGRIKTDRRAMFKWQRDLMEALAKNHFCMHFISEIDKHDGRRSRTSKQHVLLGRSVYVNATLSLYDYLVVAIKRAADEQGFAHAAQTEKEHHMFIEGAVTRLMTRLHDLRVEREEEEERKREEAKTRSRHPSAAPNGSGTEIVLAEVYQSENDLNDDFRRGLEPGTTARNRAAANAKREAQDALYEKLQNDGVPERVAYYMAYAGYSRTQAEQIVEDNAERERRLDEELAKRKPRKSRASSSRGPSWTQADQREWERTNSSAYKAGDKTGSSISLNTQVGSDSKRRIR